MTSVRVEFDQRAAAAALAEVARLGSAVANLAMDEAAEVVLGEAQADSPVRTGFLQSSHVVEHRGQRAVTTSVRSGPAGSLSAEVSRLRDASQRERLLGVNASYALAVHERHPTKARWFTSAVSEHLGRVLTIALRRAASRVTGGPL